MPDIITREYLAKRGIQIVAGGKQILRPEAIYLDEEETLSLPSYYLGDKPETLPPKVRDSTSCSELRTLGFGVVSRSVSQIPNYRPIKKKQKQVYILKRTDDGDKVLENLPKDTKWQYDLANQRIRLVGPSVYPNGHTEWVPLSWKFEEARETKYENIYEIFANRDKILRNYKKNVLGVKIRERVYIQDLPVGLTESGEILCIPTPEPSKPDEPRIGIWGVTGFGKSLLFHGIIDRAYAYWGVRVSHWNDSQSEAGDWCLPDENYGIDYGLGYTLNKLHEKPRAMPIVYLTPCTRDSTIVMRWEEGIGYKISLPYNEIIANTHWYFDLQGSAKYFNSCAPDFLTCETPDELVNLFATGDKDMSYEEYKSLVKAKQIEPRETPPEQSISFVRATFDDLYRKKIVDKWSGDEQKKIPPTPSMWKIYQNGQYMGEFNPMVACILCGLVPILETSDILTKNYFAQYFSYFARDLFEKQNSHPLFANVRTWVIIDELGDIAKKNRVTFASDILEQLQAKGRKRRIGTIVVQQNYSQVPDKIASNCRTVFCFNSQESDKICYDLGLSPHVASRIKELQRFEFMAYSKDYFTLYDFDGNKTTTQGPVFCTLLPPLSTHSSPIKKKVVA